ncbi:hypothetical protein MKY37_22100 [Psychrobacillus sp. FSL K6-2836]|uniref:hypothetical protein n=1 Tax=Psychrobacillus sp. FSL K6-2836 TaxID=2921548 RepID=UPI0030F72AC7
MIVGKGGDSGRISETDETSQANAQASVMFIAHPAEANKMLVTKALPHEVAFLAFVPLSPSETEISRIIYSILHLEPSITGHF